MLELLTGTGLATAAGLNAALPLVLLGALDRWTGLVSLPAGWEWLSNGWVLVILAVLLVVDVVADKIPGLDHVSDIVHTAIRPVAGAILAAAVADASGDLNVWLGGVIGLTGAGATHAAKMSTRPVITASTGGVGNPVVSMVEDFIATISSLVAVFLPLLLLVVLPLFGYFLYAIWKRMRRGSARLRAAASRGS